MIVVVRARCLNHRQFVCFFTVDYIPAGLPCHTEVRWLSQGAVLKRFIEIRKEIAESMEKKGRPVNELIFQEWLRDVAFLSISHST